MAKLTKKVLFKGKLLLITGLRIGDSKENADIGGVDLPIVRRKDNNEPYLPGSSIKGKMRCLLELCSGENSDSKSRQNGSIICLLFGAADSQTASGNQSRIIVRDAYLTRDSEKMLAESPYTDMPYSEIKFENTIDRLRGVTVRGGIRQVERIPAGAEFNIEFIINIFEGDNEKALLQTFHNAIKLLENDYLGGSGSRGYGQVKIYLNPKTEILASEFIVQA